jgi:4-hydroxy 2-oxovalerate aldolase
MKKNIKILDCTLRDGIRLIGNQYPDESIRNVACGLRDANIDIIEMGFLRSGEGIEYKKGSTYFTEISQIADFIPQERGSSEYVVFTDYGAQYKGWDFNKIKPCDGTSVTGFRVGYRKEDLAAAIDTFKTVQENGYKLFIQGVESLNYSDREMLETIDIINELQPYSFGLVDTYGAMYKEDALHLFNLVSRNLDENIAIDFHSHNNMQLSFSLAQEIVQASGTGRTILIDATLDGLGGGAGNLNTELIADYLNSKYDYEYNMDAVFDTIDEYVDWIKEKNTWSYSIPHYFAGIYNSHANNITYLLDKHRIGTKDIRNILTMIDPVARKRYNYGELEKLYIEYSDDNCDDSNTLAELKKKWNGRPVMMIAPGASSVTERGRIEEVIADRNPVCVSVNHVVDHKDAYAFYANPRRYKKDEAALSSMADHIILVSNVRDEALSYHVRYSRLISKDLQHFDNSSIMFLNLLRLLDVKEILIAGLDGYDVGKENYFHSGYSNHHKPEDYQLVNDELRLFLTNYCEALRDSASIAFVTTSMFADIGY